MSDYIRNMKLDYLLFNGIGGIPYATFGMVGLVFGVLVYATINDVVVETSEDIKSSMDSIQYSNTVQSLTRSISDIGASISSTVRGEEEQEGAGKNMANEPGEQYKMGGKRSTKRHSRRSKLRKTKRKTG